MRDRRPEQRHDPVARVLVDGPSKRWMFSVRISKKRSRSRCHSSGSTCSANSMELFRSAKRGGAVGRAEQEAYRSRAGRSHVGRDAEGGAAVGSGRRPASSFSLGFRPADTPLHLNPRIPAQPQGSNSRQSRTCNRTRKRLPRKSFPGAPGPIRTADLRFRKLCEVGLRGSVRVLGTPNLAKRGKPCPGWSSGKLQKKQQPPAYRKEDRTSNQRSRGVRRDRLGHNAARGLAPALPARLDAAPAAFGSDCGDLCSHGRLRRQ